MEHSSLIKEELSLCSVHTQRSSWVSWSYSVGGGLQGFHVWGFDDSVHGGLGKCFAWSLNQMNDWYELPNSVGASGLTSGAVLPSNAIRFMMASFLTQLSRKGQQVMPSKWAESDLSRGLRPHDTSCGIYLNTLQTKELDRVCRLLSVALQLLKFDILSAQRCEPGCLGSRGLLCSRCRRWLWQHAGKPEKILPQRYCEADVVVWFSPFSSWHVTFPSWLCWYEIFGNSEPFIFPASDYFN